MTKSDGQVTQKAKPLPYPAYVGCCRVLTFAPTLSTLPVSDLVQHTLCETQVTPLSGQ